MLVAGTGVAVALHGVARLAFLGTHHSRAERVLAVLVADTGVAVALHDVARSARRRGHSSADRVFPFVVANTNTVLGANRVAEFAHRRKCSRTTFAAVAVGTNHGESVPIAHAKLTVAPEAGERGTTRTLVVGTERQSGFLTVAVVAVAPEGNAVGLAAGRRSGNQSAQNVERRTVHQSATVGATVLVANTGVALDFVRLSGHTMCVVGRRQQLQRAERVTCRQRHSNTRSGEKRCDTHQ